ncbi:MAG: CrcB family protein [Bdellovibrionales bacterium]|nr:CrcB family protein [Bdellovibrionales bacterium]
MKWIVFVTLSSFGAGLRWLFNHYGEKYFEAIPIPMGTLLANSLGAFLIGWIYASYSQSKLNISGPLFLLLIIAFLGSLTTFSSFALDSIKLFQNGLWNWALLNIFLNNFFALSLCYLGIKLN